MAERAVRTTVETVLLTTSCLLMAAGATAGAEQQRDLASPMNAAAERYVKLVLAVGEHDPGYVDAYYGPAEWLEKVKEENLSLPALEAAAGQVLSEIEPLDVSDREELVQLRHRYLVTQLRSLAARVKIFQGEKLDFDDESKALYDVVAPVYPESHYQAILSEIDKKLPPGEGTLLERYEAYRRQFVVPADKLEAVFAAAMAEARRRTRQRIELPSEEALVVEYVRDKPWGAYAWYKGDSRSTIQINTDLPTHLGDVVSLACHEGYPGHHVYNTLQEKHLVRDRGWMEFTVFALYSPQSLIAEGTAEAGIEIAFPPAERVAFERDVLFPMAGLDPAKAQRYWEVRQLLEPLGYARNEAARQYLAGKLDADQAAAWLGRNALLPPARARKAVQFMTQYRSYVINYNFGKDLVEDFLRRQGATADEPRKLWAEYANLLASPRVPSELRSSP